MSNTTKREYTEQEVNSGGCNQDMSHMMEYNLSIPKHLPSFKDIMMYMVITWGVIIIGMFGISAYITS
jgi:hypothetical protein